ncbi:uncharacterized protein [Rutidosis leptorrhynchoides]|uniref:uncharacterized protein n=1 Tax=Rutidosis leptorrhynchoides TaxID=125765 RepID=UPI003A99D70B
MISSDVHPPPVPNCSSSDHLNQQKFHAFKISYDDDDDKAHASVSDIDLLKSVVADLHDTPNSKPSFSIRDYVYNSRSKDIVCNWPFSQKTLQVCLKHGVKNLLPPFESIETLRNTSSNEQIISSCDGKSNSETILEPKTSKKSQSYLQEDSGQTKSKKVIIDSSETVIKKCRIVGVEPMKEVTPMATKVCPVCKNFSSSSNTTLNAHIDQCLYKSGELSTKQTANPKVVVKHRIKPRKMRLMVNIYKTARHCTVEELDARNGTSWANNSTFSSQELKFHGENERKETNVVPEVHDRKGDVYIDTNGTKVRILSKVDTADDHGVRTTLKAGKSSKFFTPKKKNKNLELKNQHKYLEASPHSQKLKPFSEVRIGREENVGIKKSCKEAMNKDDLPIVRPPWACSKRTVLVKKSQNPIKNAVKNMSIANRAPSTVLSQHNSEKIATFSKYKDHFAKKRSPPLTEPTFKRLKKIGTISDNSCEDRKLSSFGKKLNLKRKVSAIERSCVGPYQDSAKQKSLVDEDSSASMKTDFVTPSCDVESYTKETRSLDEPFGTEFPKMVSEPIHIDDVADDMADDVADDVEMQQKTFEEVDPIQLTEPPGFFLNSHDLEMVSEKLQRSSSMATFSRVQSSEDWDSMSSSPISTISNPNLARFDSDKFAPTNSSDYWRSMTTASFKNDQPCCCSKKDITLTQTAASSIQEPSNFMPHMFPVAAAAVVSGGVQAASPAMKFPNYSECDSVSSPLKPVLRLMGKNLTVVNTDDYQNAPQISPMGQFPNVPNAENHASNTMFRSTTYADYIKSQTRCDGHVISEMNVHNAPSNSVNEIIFIPENDVNRMSSGYQSQQRSLGYNNKDSFQGYSGLYTNRFF